VCWVQQKAKEQQLTLMDVWKKWTNYIFNVIQY
jgi:hypothetical protein